MATFNPYLNFNGNTEEAFNFYKSVFGGEFSALSRLKDMPENAGCEMKITEEEKEKILHVSLPIGNNNFLMGSDIVESYGHNLSVGNNFHLSIHPESKEKAETYFNGLSEGGSITMPLGDTFWGAYFGCLTDKFGINWMVNYDYNSK